MSWSSYFIISQDATLKTAQKYIIFNLGGGFALLGAIVLIYSFTGTFIYDDIIFNKIPVELRKPIYILLFITISIKSGLIPFHYWVVDTYQEADNLFSAILSAIISKSGILNKDICKSRGRENFSNIEFASPITHTYSPK